MVTNPDLQFSKTCSLNTPLLSWDFAKKIRHDFMLQISISQKIKARLLVAYLLKNSARLFVEARATWRSWDKRKPLVPRMPVIIYTVKHVVLFTTVLTSSCFRISKFRRFIILKHLISPLKFSWVEQASSCLTPIFCWRNLFFFSQNWYHKSLFLSV